MSSFGLRIGLGFSLDPILRFEWALASISRPTYRHSQDFPLALIVLRSMIRLLVMTNFRPMHEMLLRD